MRNIGEIVDKNFVATLLEEIQRIGVERKSVRAIFIEGSALYLDNPGDIDFKIIVAWHNPKAEIGKAFRIKGYKVECTYYTLDEWNSVDKSRRIFYYITESPDMILVYGTDEDFKRYDVVKDRDLARKVLGFYDKYLFNAPPKERVRGREDEEIRMPQKRLWNFLLFAYKIMNGSHRITEEQMRVVQEAHDLKTSIEDHRALFECLQKEIGGIREWWKDVRSNG